MRKTAAAAQDQVRQLAARGELKNREAKDCFALARAANQKAKALEGAGLAQASPLPFSPLAYTPQALQTPAMLRGLAGGSGPGSRAWLGSPDQAPSHPRMTREFVAVQSTPHGSPATPAPADRRNNNAAEESEAGQAQLLQATW